MNTHELIEYTMLHALGLLEDDERSAYEAAFAAAPLPVQQRVRAEARRMADLGDLMTGAEPDAGLKDVVVAAVRAAMREKENETRIARDQASDQSSDRTPDRAAHAIAGRIDADRPALSQPAHRQTAQPRLTASKRVNSAWRVGAIACAAACITMGVVMINIQQTMRQAQNLALVDSLYDQIGAQFLESTIFDANTQRVALTSTDSSSKAVAAVWHNPDWSSARLFVKNLAGEQDRPLRLVVLDENDNIVEEITTFTPSGKLEDFDIEVNLSTQRKLAIYHDVEQEIEQALEPVLISSDSSL